MNRSQARELEEGEEVVFAMKFWPFTLGKKYKIKKGRGSEKNTNWIEADNGISYPIISLIYIEHHFEKITETEGNK